MSAPTPNQPNEMSSSTPNQSTKKKKVNPRAVFFLLIIIAAVGYLIAVHHSSHYTMTNDKKPNNGAKISNVTVPSLPNFIGYTFNLTDSMQNNIITQKNGTIYLQISGYFNQFPDSSPQYLSGKIYIIYMEITVYNGTTAKNVIIPVFTLVNYNKQQYFVYQAEGNIPQLQQLATILSNNEFIAVTFYTNSSIQIQGYTVW
jgi:hypothetical protein